MIMSAHQPAYLPWLGYFDKIKRSDVFIFLDTVQYDKNSFTNRNKIKTANGPIWLTVPVIKTDHFDKIYPQLEKLYSEDYRYLVDMTWNHLMFWLKLLGIKTKIIKSSELDVDGKKSDFVFELCKAVDADYYISGAMGKDYLEEDKFKLDRIEVEFQDYHHPVYHQLYGEFLPAMGIVDFVMNTEEYSLI